MISVLKIYWDLSRNTHTPVTLFTEPLYQTELLPPNLQQHWSFYSTQFIILVYIIMSDRDPNKQPEKLELQSRQIAMILDK